MVLYKDVVNSDFTVKDFTIKLKANITPWVSSDVINSLNPRWTKLSGPSSGALSATTGVEVNYENPKEGGVYKFKFELDGFSPTEFCVVLPLAGAEMDGVMQANLTMADAFVTRMKAKYNSWTRNNSSNLERWFYEWNSGDYVGRPDNQATPAVWYYGQVSTANYTAEDYGLGVVCTWKGRPVRMSKMSNFIVAYTQQKLGLWYLPAKAAAAKWYGTRDLWGSTAAESFDKGWDFAKYGGNYNTIVGNLVNYIWTNEKADDKTKRPWPNLNPPDNDGGSPLFDDFDYDRYADVIETYMKSQKD